MNVVLYFLLQLLAALCLVALVLIACYIIPRIITFAIIRTILEAKTCHVNAMLRTMEKFCETHDHQPPQNPKKGDNP